MLFELVLIPVGDQDHTSGHLAEAMRIIAASGLPYQLGPTATAIEGAWDEVMPVIRRCHDRLRELAPHVVTSIRIEDDGETGKLRRNVESVAEKAGQRDPALAG